MKQQIANQWSNNVNHMAYCAMQGFAALDSSKDTFT